MKVQEYTSKDTSVNTVSAVYKYITTCHDIILDYGGGKYDTNAEYMRRNFNSTVLVYDPYNRTEEHNKRVIDYFLVNPAKIVVCSNVLNIIKEDEIILDILQKIDKLIAVNGLLYIKVYERDKSGVGCKTTKGWQRNERLPDYYKFFNKVFGQRYLTLRTIGDIIILTKVV